MEPVDNKSLKEELQTYKHFFVYSEMKNGRHRVFSFGTEKLDARTLSQKLDTVFVKLKCAGKLNVAFGFVLKNAEDGTCPYFYAHENDTLMEWSKFVATKQDLVNIDKKMSKADADETCKKERHIQGGNSKNSQTWLFLLLYSEKFP